jgi:sigma-B regulation protein RsbU (phosphoserine phosphatase)
VPPVWRPWFDAITQAFDASVQLAGLRQELQIAAHMQQTLLPRPWPHDARFELRGTMVPAKDIGGDFFDHFLLPADRVGLVVADVSGKGIPAGLFGMLSKTLLRSHATQRPRSPTSVISQVNDALCEDNEASMFVTTFYGQYDPATGDLVYVNAGHPPPLLLRADGQLQWLPGSGGMALGVVSALVYREARVQLTPGDTLLVFTDGVTEAVDPLTREFGADRLASLLGRQTQIQPQHIIEQVLQAVRDFSAGVEPHDDITCLALRCLSSDSRA